VLGSKKRCEVAKKVGRVAKSKYGNLKRRKIRPPLDQLVLSLLSRYTSTSRATRGLRELKRSFVDWNEVRVSTTAEVAAAMSATDWAATCAELIHEILNGIFEACNEVSLVHLADLTDTQARTFLQGLDGMSRDLADEVLLFSREVELLPVGEQAARVSYRLGLIRTERPTINNQKVMMALWDPDLYPNLALLFLDYGNSVCLRGEARCKSCALRSVCLCVGL